MWGKASMRIAAASSVALCVLAQAGAASAGPSRYDEKEAATSLFKRSLYIIGAAAYCSKNV